MNREQRKQRADALRGREIRRSPTPKFECRASNGTLTVAGYACVTGVPYDMSWMVESVSAGAFAKTLAEKPDVQLLLNHGDGGSGLPLARTTNDSLDLEEDEKGLHFVGRMSDSDPDAQILASKVDSGLLDQCSMAFQAIRSAWSEDFDERDIQEISLSRGDVSVVNYAASPTTSVTMRSVGEFLSAMPDDELEAFLRSLRADQKKQEAPDGEDAPTLVSLMDMVRALEPDALTEFRSLLLPPPVIEPVIEPEPEQGMPLDVFLLGLDVVRGRSAA